MNKTTSTQHDDAEKIASPDVGKRLSLGGCLLRAATGLILLGVIAYFVQAWNVEEVDPELVKPVVIGSSADAEESSADPEIAALPAGAITATVSQKMIDEAEYPLAPLLKLAQLGIDEVDAKYRDYTTTLVSQVRIDGELQEEKYVFCKILHSLDTGDSNLEQPQIPFSVYSKFLAPKKSLGQEAIWIEGQNDGKIIAHPPGMLNLKRVFLDPDGPLAMKGNLHPIYDIGFRNLLVKMIELGERDLKHPECSVKISRAVEVNGRLCTSIEVVHPQQRGHFEHYIDRIFIDDELNIPIAYEAFLWPEKPGEDPPLLERYIYTKLKLNVGFTDVDFDPGNHEYDFPAW